MTTIAWDGRTLAADKQSTSGGTPTPTTKIFEAISPDGERWIYGCSGQSAMCQEFTRRLNAGLPMTDMTDFDVLAVDPAGGVWWASHNLVWSRMQVKNWAMGSGADYALGAMAAGASAAAAIDIAMRLDVNTGIGVDALELHP
jgi:hypothetical protein